jgi:uncharacterized membrane protein
MDSMTGHTTIVGGIDIPSVDPVFLAVTIGVHIPLGIACVVAGAGAMLSQKGRGRHSRFGTVYFYCLLALFASATFLAVLRWSEDRHLFALGALAFLCAWTGRSALRGRWRHWVRLHITGLGSSYIFLLIAFYVDNGKQLPIWRDLPPVSYWLLPLLIATPVLVRALLYHPLTRAHREAR